MKTNITSRNYQSGVGLVEVMVAITLGLLLIGGVSQIYLSSKNTYRASDAIARLQENGRFAIMKLQEDIRMAGYFGCGAGGLTDGSFSITNNLQPDGVGNQQTIYGDFDVGITGEDDFDGGTSDSLTILRTSNSGVRISSQMVKTSADLKVTPATFEAGDILLICDVEQGDIFQMTGPASSGPSNPTENIVHNSGTGDPGNYNPGACGGTGNVHCLSKSYGINAKVMQIEQIQYWVANGPAGIPALFRSINGAAGVELVEGVENMQVVYGLDTVDDDVSKIDSYADAGSIANWDQVISARVSLLFRSTEDNVAQSAHKYTFDVDGNGTIDAGEQDITVADRRLRQVYTTTINLRNRTFIDYEK